jgi:hypothetical protein
MAGNRIAVEGEKGFVPREWLRREVLWASLMSPYPQQMQGWLDGRAADQHAGNVSRQEIYAAEDDPQAQALAFFNRGKKIGGIISSAVLFKAASMYYIDRPPMELLELQAGGVDKVLGRTAVRGSMYSLDEEAYQACKRLIAQSQTARAVERRRNYLNASRIMARLASAETAIWLAEAEQSEDNSLPVLSIPDGGHPRSAGARVDRLQVEFLSIVDSEEFIALSSSELS